MTSYLTYEQWYKLHTLLIRHQYTNCTVPSIISPSLSSSNFKIIDNFCFVLFIYFKNERENKTQETYKMKWTNDESHPLPATQLWFFHSQKTKKKTHRPPLDVIKFISVTAWIVPEGVTTTSMDTDKANNSWNLQQQQPTLLIIR